MKLCTLAFSLLISLGFVSCTTQTIREARSYDTLISQSVVKFDTPTFDSVSLEGPEKSAQEKPSLKFILTLKQASYTLEEREKYEQYKIDDQIYDTVTNRQFLRGGTGYLLAPIAFIYEPVFLLIGKSKFEWKTTESKLGPKKYYEAYSKKRKITSSSVKLASTVTVFFPDLAWSYTHINNKHSTILPVKFTRRIIRSNKLRFRLSTEKFTRYLSIASTVLNSRK